MRVIPHGLLASAHNLRNYQNSEILLWCCMSVGKIVSFSTCSITTSWYWPHLIEQVTGDVRVIFYQKMFGGRLFYCCFNAAFIRNGLLQVFLWLSTHFCISFYNKKRMLIYTKSYISHNSACIFFFTFLKPELTTLFRLNAFKTTRFLVPLSACVTWIRNSLGF